MMQVWSARLSKVLRHSRRFVGLLRHSPADQWLALKAFALLGHSRYLIKRHGLKRIEPMLGHRMAESPTTIAPEHQELARRVAWAINGVRIYAPWVANCFPQALTAHRLLKQQGVTCTVYFGAVLRAPEDALAAGASHVGAFAAHAWTRCGDADVTGGDLKHLYEPMVWFSQFE